MEVINKDEPAYLCNLYFTLPNGIGLHKTPQTCYQTGNSDSSDVKQEIYVCNLGNPLNGSTSTAKHKVGDSV